MRLGEIRKVAARAAAFSPGNAAPEPTEQPAASHALIPLAPVADAHEPHSVMRQAPFLAQLIATKDQHPQTRERRRAEPADAVAAYRAAIALSGS